MSKHVWRGMSEGQAVRHVTTNVPYKEWFSCTVIEDAACFPVKEAMRLCQLVDKQDHSFDGTAELGSTLTSYRKAVARMKAKAKKGHK